MSIIKKIFFPFNEDKVNCGFHRRLFATLIDCMLLALVLTPLFKLTSNIIYGGILPNNIIYNIIANQQVNSVDSITAIKNIISAPIFQKFLWEEYGAIRIVIDQSLQIITISGLYIFFWIKIQATPGKKILRMKIVDYKTGNGPTKLQLFLRWCGYLVSLTTLFLGFIWIAFDKEKRGLHDYIASTKVIPR